MDKAYTSLVWLNILTFLMSYICFISMHNIYILVEMIREGGYYYTTILVRLKEEQDAGQDHHFEIISFFIRDRTMQG
jgi:hypothetical protein